jgi:hypothetical protein
MSADRSRPSALHLHQGELLPEEHVRWSGSPTPRSWFVPVDRLLAPFSVLWLALSFGILIAAIRNHETYDARTIVAALFSVAGLYLVGGRVLARRWLCGRTLFVVTNRRVVVLRSFPRRTVEALPIDQIDGIRKWVRRSGVATIQFGDMPWLRNVYGQTGLELLGTVQPNAVPVFYNIAAADEVLEVVAPLQSKGP